MTVDECIIEYVLKNKGKEKGLVEIKEELFLLLKSKCNYKLDVRTIRGKEILEEVREKIGNEHIRN